MMKSLAPGSPATDAALVELVEIQPVILGGSPRDPGNKVLLTKRQHVEYVRFWNAELKKRRQGQQT